MFNLKPEQRGQVLRELSAALANTPRLRAAWAFGSFLRGESFRDVDVGVWLHEPSWRDVGRIERIARSAPSMGSWPIDVILLNDARPGFRVLVADQGRLLWECAPGEALLFGVIAGSMEADRQAWESAHRWTQDI